MPRANRGVILFNLKCYSKIVSRSVDGTAASLSEYSFIKFRGQRVLKCRTMCSASTEFLWKTWHCFSGNCPLWERIKRNNGSSVLCWNQTLLLATSSRLSKHNVSMLCRTIIREIKTLWSTELKEALRSDCFVWKFQQQREADVLNGGGDVEEPIEGIAGTFWS